MPYKNVNVIAYSGYRRDEKPQSFFMNNEKVDVVEILETWIEESLLSKTRKRFFIIKGKDKKKYKIYNDEESAEWFCEIQ